MDAFVVDAKRTPLGRAHRDKGALKDVRADELLAALFANVAEGVDPALFDDVLIGCVGQHLEQGKNIARLASLLAGFPDHVPGVTVNRLCASSLQAFNFAAMAVHCGQADVVLAGGVEHMHHVPMTAALDYNQELLERYPFPFTNMGLTAERVADVHAISREDQDAFALESHRKASAAQRAGYFDTEIVPIALPDGGIAERDQGPRESASMDALAGLKPVFKEDGTVTAGNSSPLSDGASVTVIASDGACERHGLERRARICDAAVVGLDPCMMGMGPVSALRKLLQRNALAVDDVDCFELNEAFASQAIACNRELGIPEDKVNLAGGAVALGHPLGCTGTRLVTTLVHNMERTGARTGVAGMCIGHGQGMAVLLERN